MEEVSEVDEDGWWTENDGPPSGYGTSAFNSGDNSDPSPGGNTAEKVQSVTQQDDDQSPGGVTDTEEDVNQVTGTETEESGQRPMQRMVEEIVFEGDDSFYGGRTSDRRETILISDLVLTTVDEAREIANFILDEMEADVQAYFDQWGDEPPVFDKQSTTTSAPNSPGKPLSDTTSGLSISSKFSLPEPGEPSTLKLWYEKGESELRTTSIPRIPMKGHEDVACEANLHRGGRKFRRSLPPQTYEDFTQTRELGLVSHFTADQLYRRLYPEKDNYRKPPTPTRNASLEGLLDVADEAENVDKPQIGPKVKWSKRTRLLPPLPENYARGETFWTGSIFRGEYLNRQFNHGNYNYPLMSTYSSEFREGYAHSKKHLGIVVYPRGDTFEGQWRKGRFMSGNIVFGDELEFEPQNWTYCVPPDRRFYIERDVGVKQAGRTLYNDRLPPPTIPPGMYDTGDGIYNPKTGVVAGFNGQKLRDASASEREWIFVNCRKAKTVEERYIPSFSVDRLPCSYTDKYFKQ